MSHTSDMDAHKFTCSQSQSDEFESDELLDHSRSRRVIFYINCVFATGRMSECKSSHTV